MKKVCVRGAHEAAARFHQAETAGLAVLEDDVAAEDDVAEVEVNCSEEQKICTLTGSEMSLVSPSVEIGDVRRGDLGRSLETYNARTGDSEVCDQGDHVRIGAGGVSVFTIVSVDEGADSAIIESTVDAHGRYPFPAKLANLVPPT